MALVYKAANYENSSHNKSGRAKKIRKKMSIQQIKKGLRKIIKRKKRPMKKKKTNKKMKPNTKKI